METPNQHPSDPGVSNDQVGGNVDSEHLLQNIIEREGDVSPRTYSFLTQFYNIRSRLVNFNSENQLEELAARRRIIIYLLIILLLVLVIGLNFIPYVDNGNTSREPYIFSTYYTSKYRICLPPSLPELYNKHPVNSNVSGKTNETDFSQSSVDFNENGERCVDGDVDITLFYKDVNLDGYYRVYAAMSFQLDYQGKWYQVWKNKHFFSSKKRYKRLFFALSNLISIDNFKGTSVLDKEIIDKDLMNIGTNLLGGTTERGEEDEDVFDDSYTGISKTKDSSEDLEKLLEKMTLEREKIEKELETLEARGHLFMSSFVPNFINTKNLPDEYKKENDNLERDIGHGYGINNRIYEKKKDGKKVMNSIRLNRWNEFAKQQDVKSFNIDIKMKTDPLRYYTIVNSNKGLSNNPNVSPLPRKKLKSLRELDDFYLLNLRKYVQNEYQHISSFDTSIYNIFNLTQISRTSPAKGSYNFIGLPKKNKDNDNKNTNKTSNESKREREVTRTEPMRIIPREILDKYFNPVNMFENSNITSSDYGKNNGKDEDGGIKVVTSNSDNKNMTSHSSSNSSDGNDTDEDEFTGVMNSNDSGIKLYFRGVEKDMRKLKKMITTFLLIFVLKCLIEAILVYKQFSKLERSAIGRSISLTSLCMLSYQEVLEIFLLLYHGGIFFENLVHFGALMILKFFLLCIVHQNFIVLVWRATHSQHIRQGWAHTQKAFILFYRYYFTFVVILLIIWYYFYGIFPIVISLAYLAWFPQIMLDIWRSQNNSMDFQFIFLSVILKLSLPFYIFYVKDNVFNYDQFSVDSIGINRNLVYFLSFLSSAQLILISIQRLYGPRHFAKWSILPKIYSYVRPWSKMMQDDPQECVICMYDIVQSNRDWYLTPCDHLFHANCLREWTSIKLECPNCRRPLPPIT